MGVAFTAGPPTTRHRYPPKTVSFAAIPRVELV
jgi:hypothetical protein